jgi:preprotein translocase subunit SecE
MEFLRRIRQFFQDVTREFRRVTWPSRAEVVNSTVIVLVLVAVLGVYLWVVDVGLSQLYVAVERMLR